jgi:hypothetical protein
VQAVAAARAASVVSPTRAKDANMILVPIPADRPLGLAREVLRTLLIRDGVPDARAWSLIAPLDVRQLISLIADASFRSNFVVLALDWKVEDEGPYRTAVEVLLDDKGRARVEQAYEDAWPHFERDSDTPTEWVRAFYFRGDTGGQTG